MVGYKIITGALTAALIGAGAYIAYLKNNTRDLEEQLKTAQHIYKTQKEESFEAISLLEEELEEKIFDPGKLNTYKESTYHLLTKALGEQDSLKAMDVLCYNIGFLPSQYVDGTHIFALNSDVVRGMLVEFFGYYAELEDLTNKTVSLLREEGFVSLRDSLVLDYVCDPSEPVIQLQIGE